MSDMSSGGNASSGLLTDKQIEHFHLIREYNRENCKPASYDLTIGDRHYLYEDSGNWKAVFLGSSNGLNEANEKFGPDSPLLLSAPRRGATELIIPPFGSAIIQLDETIDLYNLNKQECQNDVLIAGRFDLKLKSIYKGLISQQATQVEPGYIGKLYCFVYNLGSQEVVLKKGDGFATIEFYFVSSNSIEDNNKLTNGSNRDGGSNSKYSGQFCRGTEAGGQCRGIYDIRWLYEQGMLPKECGMAPIYNLVNGNINDAVAKHLERSDTIDRLAQHVGNRLNERQNAIKIIISLVAAIITFFATSFLISINAELRYFQEELAFFGDLNSGGLGYEALQAIEEHTNTLEHLRQCQQLSLLIFSALIVGLLLILFFAYMRPRYKRKWEQKRQAMEAKYEYKQVKKELKEKKKQEKEGQKTKDQKAEGQKTEEKTEDRKAEGQETEDQKAEDQETEGQETEASEAKSQMTNKRKAKKRKPGTRNRKR